MRYLLRLFLSFDCAVRDFDEFRFGCDCSWFSEKSVKDVDTIANGHEREEIQADLEVFECYNIMN